MAEPRPKPAASLQCPNCGAPASTDATRCAYCRAQLATVACPSCLGPIFMGTRYCPACGAAASRTMVQSGEAIVCPRCRAAMQVVRVGEVELAECPDCEGLWLEAGAFERVCTSRETRAAFLHRAGREHTRTATKRVPQVRYRPCARCGKLMNRINFGRASGIIVDVCRGHGTFLDPGEMKQVTAFIDRGGLDLARERERQELAEEQRRLRVLQDGPAARLSHDVRVDDVRDGSIADFLTALFDR
jgi:Zn-finger nucleic acid-binding protein/predicted RNA-binding Zn-ribbon protein involved in translation (DUF1610 family)